MEALTQQNLWLAELVVGFIGLTFKQAVMWLVGGGLIWAAVKKGFQPFLTLSAGVGIILANLPYSGASSLIPGEEGFLWMLYQFGIANELLIVAMLILTGACCDFSALLRRPALLLVAFFCQLGIFAAVWAATAADFSLPHAAAVGITSVADAAVAMYVASRSAEGWFGVLALTAFVLAALAPVIQPPVVRALTTAAERRIEMADCSGRPATARAKLFFALGALILTGLIAPKTASLIGALIFGNLWQELGRPAKAAWPAERLAAVVRLPLGFIIGGTMYAERVLSVEAAIIVAVGVGAFVINTACGVVAVKLLNIFCSRKINPLLGACGVAAFPAPGRAAARLALAENGGNDLSDYAIGVNAAGQIAAILSGGVILAIIPALLK